MIRISVLAGVLALAAAFHLTQPTKLKPPVATPMVTETIDRSGERIRFAKPVTLNAATVPSRKYQVKSLLNVPGRVGYGEYAWNENGVPDAPLWVFVDLTAQTISVFRGSHEIGTSVLLYGADDMPTPTGRFKVLRMRKDHWSGSYDAPMPYSLWLTDDGVAIHGSVVRPGAATHGCLGVPLAFAKRLFAVASVGDEVVVTRVPRSSASSA